MRYFIPLKWKMHCNETSQIKTVVEFNIETMGFNPVKQLETKMVIALKRDSEIVLCNYTIHHTLISLKATQYTNLV
jgi:hypothetical protein